MKVCKYCHCTYWRYPKYEGIEGDIVELDATFPSWVIDKDDKPPIPPGFACCSCPCHFTESTELGIAYLGAVKEIFGLEVINESR